MSIANRKIRVLVVDDSAMVRKMITDALSKDPQIEVVGAAPDPYVARDMIVELEPDVLTLDIEMPRMDGLTFLKILQKHKPMPVVVISSISQAGSAAALEAINSGAVEVLAKPTSAFSIGSLADQLPRCIKAAAVARLRAPGVSASAPVIGSSTGAVAQPRVAAAVAASKWNPKQLIAIGASTGGIEALTEVLTHLPGGLPGICITQHMPAHFSKMFAERVNAMCAFEVREAAEGDMLVPGLCLLAPGDYHMTLKFVGAGYRVELNQKPPVHHCRPAVDVMFRSISECAGAKVVSAILTGMGVDGALGMKLLKGIGARTIAQNEETCVVYGMPRAAVEMGCVDKILPLNKIAGAIVEGVQAQLASGAASVSSLSKPTP
ncbi:MAG: chemotaxis response regulator protein-glutamate methylesterase [Verrucomicrobiota bacterium]